MEMLEARLAVYQVCQTRGSPEGRMGHIYGDLRAAHVYSVLCGGGGPQVCLQRAARRHV